MVRSGTSAVMEEKAYKQEHEMPSDSSLHSTLHDEEYGPVHEIPLSDVPLSKSQNKIAEAGILTQTLSRMRTKDSGDPIPPPPDGGVKAWIQVGLCHIVLFK